MNNNTQHYNYINMFIFQSYPPSCPNADENGRPKTADINGEEHARFSSQSQKKSMRKNFIKYFGKEEIGIRTKLIVRLLADEIAKLSGNTNEKTNIEKAENAYKLAGVGLSKHHEANALFFISRPQIHAMAELVIKGEKKPQAYVDALNAHPSIDMCAFGRMNTDNKDLQIDGAMVVADAISTHPIHMDQDFFAGTDDLKEHGGAAMLDTNEFYSPVMYRYAGIRIEDLFEEAEEETGYWMKKIVEAFVRAVPTGKIHAHAQETLPDFVYVTISHDELNFSPAFNTTIKRGSDYLPASIKKFGEYTDKVYKRAIGKPEYSFVYALDDVPDVFGEEITLTELYDGVEEAVNKILKEEMS